MDLTVRFRRTSGDSWTQMDAVKVIPEWVVRGIAYDDLNNVMRDEIDAYYKQWTVELGYLSVADQDLLFTLQTSEDPRFEYASTEYNVRIKNLNVRHVGSKITVIHRDPE